MGSVVPFEDPLLFPPGQGQSQNLLPPASSGAGSQTAIPESPLARVGQNNVPETGPGRIQDSVNPVEGQLTYLDTDLNISSIGFPLIFTRTYDSSSNELTPFGYSWNFSYNRYLQMSGGAFTLTEFTGDGGSRNYTFHKEDPHLLVSSFDGDSYIYYPLDKGHYTASSGMSAPSLVRHPDGTYVVTEKNGMAYTYQGYKAPWRQNASPAQENCSRSRIATETR